MSELHFLIVMYIKNRGVQYSKQPLDIQKKVTHLILRKNEGTNTELKNCMDSH